MDEEVALFEDSIAECRLGVRDAMAVVDAFSTARTEANHAATRYVDAG